MKTVVLMLIALFVGAACAFAVANTLAKRGAYGKASMIVLAEHVDALRAMDSDAVCAGPEAQARRQQIAFAAREIEFAFADLHRDTATFKRRTDNFRTAAEQAPASADCAELEQYLGSLGEGCKACHQEFRG